MFRFLRQIILSLSDRLIFESYLNSPTLFQLMKHAAKLRRRNSYWQLVDAQAVQDISDRIEKNYKPFFKHHKNGVRPPSFCKSKKYKSFTLKQAGYKIIGDKIRLGKRLFGYHKSREIEGKINSLIEELLASLLSEGAVISVFSLSSSHNSSRVASLLLSIIPTKVINCSPWSLIGGYPP